MEIGPARPADTIGIEALLQRTGLPLDGANQAFAHGVVARDGARVAGAAAVEVFGTAGLLRSVAVDEEDRGSGLGRDLVAAAEDVARREGVSDLYLLTETAVEWFPRLGYEPVDREVARQAVGGSIEFTLSCATTGVAMRRILT